MSDRTKIMGISASSYFAEKYGAEWFNRTPFDPTPDESGERGVDQVSYRAAMQCVSDLKGVRRLEAAFGALARTPTDDRGGRARNHARANYVSMLAQIYENTTGKSPRVSYDPAKERYRGPFFCFVKRNLDMVKPGHGLSNVALGTLLRRLLRAGQKPPASS